MTSSPASDPCPVCGAPTTPIVYGYPGVEMWEAAERGEVVLGGCMVSDGHPTRRCGACGHAFAPPRARGRSRE